MAKLVSANYFCPQVSKFGSWSAYNALIVQRVANVFALDMQTFKEAHCLKHRRKHINTFTGMLRIPP